MSQDLRPQADQWEGTLQPEELAWAKTGWGSTEIKEAGMEWWGRGRCSWRSCQGLQTIQEAEEGRSYRLNPRKMINH